MNFKELLLILTGAIAFIWAIVSLNDFIGGSPLLMYIGTPAVFGIFTIGIGGVVWLFVADHVGA